MPIGGTGGTGAGGLTNEVCAVVLWVVCSMSTSLPPSEARHLGVAPELHPGIDPEAEVNEAPARSPGASFHGRAAYVCLGAL